MAYIAKLSHISLTDEEIKQYQHELETIIGYVEKLQAVDTAKQSETTRAADVKNRMRADKTEDYQSTAEAMLRAAPDTKDQYLKVRRVL